MSFESWSMTPPASPLGFHLDEEVQQPLPQEPNIDGNGCLKTFLFSCNDGNNESFTNLQRLLSYDKKHRQADLPALVELFTFNFSRQRALDLDMDTLFYLLRQNIGIVQSSRKLPNHFIQQDSVPIKDPAECRLQIAHLFLYIQDYIRGEEETFVQPTFLQCLVGQLHGILLYLGRLSDARGHVTYCAAGRHGNEGSIDHHFHLYLDVMWKILETLHILQTRFTDFVYSERLCQTADPASESCLFTQTLQIILWDLVALANVRYNNKVSGGDYTKVSMFSCQYEKDLWTLLLQLVEWRKARQAGDSFWVNLHHIIQAVISPSTSPVDDTDMEIDSTMIENPPPMTVKDRTSLCLWILQQVAPLYSDRRLAGNEIHKTVTSNYHDLQTLMKKYMNSEGLNEAMLRQHLRCCCILSLRWEPNTSLLVQLWDYFFRRMNNTFQLNTTGVEGLAAMSQSAQSLYDQCYKWTLCNNDSLEKENSFQLFQRLLCLHLCRLQQTGVTGVSQEWKQMKGRFYSKFHQRRMQELTEGGLYNFTSLFLTLALTADVEDVASKLCDFYDMLDYSKMTYARRCVVWRGAFALMLVYEEKELDIGHLTDRMVGAFNSCVSEFSESPLDNRHNIWKLILVYVESLQDVFDASRTLSLSEYKLVCSGFKTLLPLCRDSELRCVLSALQSVISKFRQIYQTRDLEGTAQGIRVNPQHTELADSIWIHVYPFVKEHAVSLTPLTQLADLAAGLCLMALTFPPGKSLGNKDSFISVFQMFAMGEAVNVGVSCRFLGHLLSSGQVMDMLVKSLPSYQTLLVRAWFRCCLLVPGSTQQLHEISRCILQLKEIKQMFTVAEMEVPETYDKAAVLVMKAAERNHSKLQTWKDKMHFKDQVMGYFMDVRKQISHIIRSQGPPEAVSSIYRMAGYLVKYCAPLIFVQSKPDCPLPAIINTLILPHHVYNTEKTLNAVILSATRDTLHLYMQGLSRLDFTKDAYVQRIVKDILKVYLPKFNLKGQVGSVASGTVTTVHPIIASLSLSLSRQAGSEAVKFRHFVLQQVVSAHLTARNWILPTSNTLGLSFLSEVLNRTTSLEIKARDCPVLLPCVLECILLTDISGHSYLTSLTILQHLLEAYTVHTSLVPQSEMKTMLENFMRNYFKVKHGGVFRVFEKLAVLIRDIVIELIPSLTDSVKGLEMKTGVGVDMKLRQKYFVLLRMLGTRGEEEISSLQH